MKKKIILFILLGMTIVVFSWMHSHFWNPKEEVSNDKTKVLLIGLDGATWDVMYPLVKQNKLPNIKRLMNKGCWGGLESLHPPLISEVIWTTILTGKTPEKHGIVDRIIRNPDTGELIPTTSNLRKVKALWNILSEYNKTVGSVGYCVTWPPEEINGVIISDRTHWGDYLSEGYTYPPLVELCNQQEFEGFKNSEEKISSRIEKDKFPIFDWYTEEMRDNFMAKFADYLMDKRDFDFIAICLVGTDRVSHYFWKYMEPDGFNVTKEEIKRHGNVIKDYYIYCDRLIGDLLNKIDKDTTVIVVSDHGFRAEYEVNRAEYENYAFTRLNSLLEISGLSKIQRNSKTIIIREEDPPLYTWKQEKNIRIEGDLSGEELDGIKEEIKKALSQIITEEDNQPIFNSIQDAKNSLSVELNMSYINLYPEHHLIINNKRYKISDFLIKNYTSGNHDNMGIIVISGKHIRREKIKGASVYDIAPTILYLMGLPVAEDMDGVVLTETVEGNFLKTHPIKYIKSYETGTEKKDEKPISSPLDEELKERMRSLRYIN